MVKAIQYLAIFAVFIFPFVIATGLAFPLSFTHLMFMFTVTEFLLLLFLWHGLNRGEVTIKKSYLTAGLALYILVMLVSSLSGAEFMQSFWSSYLRGTGIITWLHYFSFFLIISSVFTEEKDWKKMFRALSLSGLLLSIFSLLGVDGLSLGFLDFLQRGGSFLGNTSYSGAYELLIFFFSVIGLSMESKREWRAVYILSLVVTFFNPDLFNFGVLSGTIGLGEVFQNPMQLVGIARTSSLVLWCGILVSVILFLIHKIKDNKKAMIAGSSLMAVLLLSYLVGFVLIMKEGSSVQDFYIKQSGPVRIMVWNMAIEGFKERPILGYGNGNFKYVYQEHLTPEIIHLENPPWFDRVHNFTLEELVNNGIVGSGILLAVFIGVIVTSFRYYLQNKKFYFLLIPFILYFHFLQLQTFFQVDCTLLLIFLFLAFLVSHEKSLAWKIPWIKHEVVYKVFLPAILLILFIFSIVIPINQNRLILTISNTEVRKERMRLEEKLAGINIDPVETMRQVSVKFSDETVKRSQELAKAGYKQNVADEYKIYLKAFEAHLPRYAHLYRYLFEYANFINSAYVFGIDELKKGEELSRQALEISPNYPYPYWVLAINLYYQGRNEEALQYAKAGLDVDPTIDKSQEIYDAISSKIQAKEKQKSFFYLPISR